MEPSPYVVEPEDPHRLPLVHSSRADRRIFDTTPDLLQDVIAVCEEAEQTGTCIVCETCPDERSDDAAEAEQWDLLFWCDICKLALCKNHLARHERSRGPHIVWQAGVKPEVKHRPTPPVCSEHGQPLAKFCETCNKAICQRCTLRGQHSKHEHEAGLHDARIVARRKDLTNKEVKHLRFTTLPSLRWSLESVEGTMANVLKRADEVKCEIGAAKKCSAEALGKWPPILEESYVDKLQEVGQLEESRRKRLSQQKYDLTRFVENVKKVICVTEWLFGLQSRLEATLFSLALLFVRKRLAQVFETSVPWRPVCHAEIGFVPVDVKRLPSELLRESNGDAAHGPPSHATPSTPPLGDEHTSVKFPECIGQVLPFHGAALHSFVEGHKGVIKNVPTNVRVDLTLQVMTCDGQRMECGGEKVETQFLETPCPQRPDVHVQDNNNGKYELSFCPSHDGLYLLDIFVNGQNIGFEVALVASYGEGVRFDAWECHNQLQINLGTNGREATLKEDSDFAHSASVLGWPGMREGQHSWRVRIDLGDPSASSFGQTLGVAEKPLPALDNNVCLSYSWSDGTTKNVRFNGWTGTGTGLKAWMHNDVVEMALDCEMHTLTMTNLRSGETDVIENLPHSTLFPYFSLSGSAKKSLTLI